MTRAKRFIDAAKERGIRLTYTHLIVRAAAVVLAANPKLHVVACGNRVNYPARVDIGLSVAGEMFMTPVLIIQGANRKTLRVIADEIIARTPEIQDEDRKMTSLLRHWGWLLPFGFLRRAMLRLLRQFPQFRQRGSGTFQVSIVPGVDTFATPVFNTAAILTAGAVRERIIADHGVPAARLTVHLTCSADHRAWDGRACQQFLLAVRDVLDGGSLESELPVEPEAGLRYE
jgi:pyruvate/2-oxoglutarate dehydrogenase complex dihydrolipoamide acyltransferase (E2) component